MTVGEFILKWKNQLDTDGTDLVGIERNWDKIRINTQIINLTGKEAWDRIYNFTPPWYKYGMRKPFEKLIEDENKEYQNEIKMEKEKKEQNKFEYILKYGMSGSLSPTFIAFADQSGFKGVLGDGCHRFLVSSYIIKNNLKDLSYDISRTELDIICLENFSEVIPFDPFN